MAIISLVCPMHAGQAEGPTAAGGLSCGGAPVQAYASTGATGWNGPQAATWVVMPCEQLQAQGWPVVQPQGVLWQDSPQVVLAS